MLCTLIAYRGFESHPLLHVAASLLACRIFYAKNTASLYRLPLLFPTKALLLREPCEIMDFAPFRFFFFKEKSVTRSVVPPSSQKMPALARPFFGSPAPKNRALTNCAVVVSAKTAESSCAPLCLLFPRSARASPQPSEFEEKTEFQPAAADWAEILHKALRR